MRKALVTGATSGVGEAIALALAASGVHVYALGRNADALADLAKHEEIEPVRLDVTNKAGLSERFANAEIDILVNNAGIMPPVVAFNDMTEADIEATIAINLSAAIGLTRIVAPGMQQRGRGHIFFTGSTAGHTPVARLAVYSATKAALAAFADGLRVDISPYGIRVTEIVAGRTETNLYKTLLSDDARAAMYADNIAVHPRDIAQMVVSVLAMPDHINIPRFDITPTRPPSAIGQSKKD